VSFFIRGDEIVTLLPVLTKIGEEFELPSNYFEPGSIARVEKLIGQVRGSTKVQMRIIQGRALPREIRQRVASQAQSPNQDIPPQSSERIQYETPKDRFINHREIYAEAGPPSTFSNSPYMNVEDNAPNSAVEAPPESTPVPMPTPGIPPIKSKLEESEIAKSFLASADPEANKKEVQYLNSKILAQMEASKNGSSSSPEAPVSNRPKRKSSYISGYPKEKRGGE
jgi:hypothetical protein